jgi:hypothetical protein
MPFLAVVVVSALFVVWSRLSAENPEQEARDLLEAQLKGDSDRIFDAALPEEIAKAHLTREGFRLIWSQLIAPRISRFHPAGPIESQLNSGQGVASVPLIDDQGHRWEMTSMVWPFEGKGKTLALESLVTAWHLDAIAQGKTSAADRVQASKNGATRDDQVLRSSRALGIVRMDRVRGTFNLLTWEEIRQAPIPDVPE